MVTLCQATIRAGKALDSDKLGNLEEGKVVSVLEEISLENGTKRCATLT